MQTSDADAGLVQAEEEMVIVVIKTIPLLAGRDLLGYVVGRVIRGF